MLSNNGAWMTPQAYSRLQTELAELRKVDYTDAHEHDLAFSFALRARIRQILDLIRNAILGETPPDDGIAEPGMVLTVGFNDTLETGTFLLAVGGDAADDGIEVYSTRSPLGAAIAGAHVGEERTYRVPSGATVSVTLLHATPYDGSKICAEPVRAYADRS